MVDGPTAPQRGVSATIDYTLICNSQNYYLFRAGDNGNTYRSDLAIGSFPGTFNDRMTLVTHTTANLFAAVQGAGR